MRQFFVLQCALQPCAAGVLGAAVHPVIQRLTGDGAGEALIAPEWTKKKTIVLNEIDKRMANLNTWQGKLVSNGR